MANLPPVLRQRYFDANGNPLAGGKLHTYAAGTTTPQATYTDSSGATPNANPLVLDANGEAGMWLDPTLSYKFVLTDASDVQQWVEDGVIGLLNAGSVVTASLADGAVTEPKIADDAVTANKLKDSADADAERAVTTNHIRDSAITTAKIADGAITGGKLSDAVDGATIEVSESKIQLKDSGVTQAKLSVRAKTTDGTDPGLGGISGSAGSSTFSSTSATYVDVTNLACTITTKGRPVLLVVQPDGSEDGSSNNAANYGVIVDDTGTSGTGRAFCRMLRGETAIAAFRYAFPLSSSNNIGSSVPPTFIDTPSAGTYTYKIQVRRETTGATIRMGNLRLVAVEI